MKAEMSKYKTKILRTEDYQVRNLYQVSRQKKNGACKCIMNLEITVVSKNFHLIYCSVLSKRCLQSLEDRLPSHFLSELNILEGDLVFAAKPSNALKLHVHLYVLKVLLYCCDPVAFGGMILLGHQITS